MLLHTQQKAYVHSQKNTNKALEIFLVMYLEYDSVSEHLSREITFGRIH